MPGPIVFDLADGQRWTHRGRDGGRSRLRRSPRAAMDRHGRLVRVGDAAGPRRRRLRARRPLRRSMGTQGSRPFAPDGGGARPCLQRRRTPSQPAAGAYRDVRNRRARKPRPARHDDGRRTGLRAAVAVQPHEILRAVAPDPGCADRTGFPLGGRRDCVVERACVVRSAIPVRAAAARPGDAPVHRDVIDRDVAAVALVDRVRRSDPRGHFRIRASREYLAGRRFFGRRIPNRHPRHARTGGTRAAGRAARRRLVLFRPGTSPHCARPTHSRGGWCTSASAYASSTGSP